jgi:hypothetical protein
VIQWCTNISIVAGKIMTPEGFLNLILSFPHVNETKTCVLVPTITPAPTAPANSTFVLVLMVKMPYTKSEFDADKQKKFKEALASAAGTSPLNVDIQSITEGGRRQGKSINVQTSIRAMDDASLKALSSQLGSGDAMLAKVNAELKKQGLSESTGVSKVSGSAAGALSAAGELGSATGLALAASFTVLHNVMTVLY